MSIIQLQVQQSTKRKNLHKIKGHSAFTLIEILIVIIIIGIIMGMTMDFGGEQIGLLRTKTVQETYLDNLNILQNQMLTSNYYEGKKFEDLMLTLEKNKSIYSKFSRVSTDIEGKKSQLENNGEEEQFVDASHTIEKIYTLDESFSEISSPLNIIYTPYRFGCTIIQSSDQEDPNTNPYPKIAFQTLYKKKKTCYSLVAVTCKYQKIDCE